ncbi:hypothetical protein HY029_03590 [Candidatus Gottesmanbacteria bacterium]|nr:hypothetical protein [Candidatus Gottesmanbacteria bacterium]
MMLVLSIIKFLGFLTFFIYIPSQIVFNLCKIKIKDNLVNIGLSFVSGIVIITLISLVIRYAGLSFSVLWIIFLLSLFYLVFRFKIKNFREILKQKIFPKNKSAQIILFLVLGMCVILQNLVLFSGGTQVSGGLAFPSPHDTMWNIALASELIHRFPADNPAVSGILLKNNHYFYPLFLSVARSITGIDIFDLYFRFGPILVSILFGLGLYSVSKVFIDNIYFRITAVFLGYFSGNFAYLLPFIFGKNFDWKGNTFFSDQPFDQLINPYSVLGFALMLFGIYCLSQIHTPKKNLSLGYSIVGGILLGSLYGFKSFGGVIVILTLVISTSISFAFSKKLTFLPVTALSMGLFVFIFLFTTDPSKASLIWAPGWLLTQLMTDQDKLNLPQFANLERFYAFSFNRLGFLKIKFIEFFIYLIGNLGTRLLGMIYLVFYFLKKSVYIFDKYIYLFMIVATIISIAIPLFFNLTNSTFNIIQFTPYALVILSLISTVILEIIYSFLVFKKQRLIGIVIIIIFIILSIPVNVKNVISKFERPKDILSYGELSALKYLQDNSNAQDIILINPSTFSQDPIYIPAISERRVYLASPGYAIQTGVDPVSRLKEINIFFHTYNKEFLAKNKIAYIYELRTNSSSNRNDSLFKLGLSSVFENDKVIIWKVNIT